MTISALLERPAPAPAHAPGPIIRARGLTRRFGTLAGVVEAVHGLDLDVAEGDLVALLGPSGAGGSTILRMLSALLRPTAGEVVVAGHDVVSEPEAVRRRVGYVGPGPGPAPARRVRDELVAEGRRLGLPAREACARADELLAALDLEPLTDRPAGALSGGRRRLVDVAIGLVRRPPLLLLDDPSAGLDPQSRANLWEHVRRLRARDGTTVALATHRLDEAEMAERVLVLDRGRVIADDTAQRLKAGPAADWIVLGAGDPAHGEQLAAAAREVVGVREVRRDGATVRVRANDAAAMLPILLYGLSAAGLHPCRADLRRTTLDDVLLALTGRSPRENRPA